MRLSSDPAQAKATVQAALDHGIDFFDHADIYGQGLREEVFSAVLADSPGLRDRIFIQSKCGIRPVGDAGPEAPALLHRPDPLVEPEEVARAFDELQRKGWVRFFGVSNHTAAQIQLLQTCVQQPLVANQVQLSVVHAQMLDSGVRFNRDDDAPASQSEGTLPFCRMQGITLQAWSPLAGGSLTGKPLSDAAPRVARAAGVVREMAEEKGVSREAVVVAWLLRHPAGIQPVIGTTNPARIAACCEADHLVLSREEWYRLFEAGRGGRVP
jgi:predicted oxidoreductase